MRARGARFSARTRLPFVNFCKNARVENGGLVLTSSLFGGKICADVRLAEGRAILGILPGSFPAEAGRSERPAVLENLALPTMDAKVVFRRLVEPAAGDIDITKAEVLVSVGRGLQNAENLPLAEELALALGGAVCASRPVIDQNWLPFTRQVGKSGMTVKPKLYFALGISGAPEHPEGMQNSQLIIAVNSDPQAPVFGVAHYGVCADLLDIKRVQTSPSDGAGPAEMPARSGNPLPGTGDARRL